MLPCPPRARRRVGGPAEACDERGSGEAFGRGSPEVSGEGASGESENCRPRRGGLGRIGESVLLLRPRRGGLGRRGLGEGASGESEILAETPFVFLVFV